MKESDLLDIVPQPVAQIPWGHNRLIISKIKDVETAIFYAQETPKCGWLVAVAHTLK